MLFLRHFSCLLLFIALSTFHISSTLAADFPLKDGDVWVMVGDSITAQHWHSNYFEAFCYARYPDLKFGFRNSGVGGDTIPKALVRFEDDIAAWKPTVVSVELGMNDKFTPGATADKFIADMGNMVERIRGIKARPVILSACPINNGETMVKLGANQLPHEFAVALKDFSAKQQIPYADQFHALIDLWGMNRSKEVSLQGDQIHPGPTGQLMMAAALLKELGANPFVSSVNINANGELVEAKGCKVDNLKADGGKIEFDRLDQCLPFPIPEEARRAVALSPTILEMSQYMLKVSGLKGNVTLKINGVETAVLSAQELEAGVNLTVFGGKDANPIAVQMRAVLAAVAANEWGIVGQLRKLSQWARSAGTDPVPKDRLALLPQKARDGDAKIRETARPQKLHFELSQQ